MSRTNRRKSVSLHQVFVLPEHTVYPWQGKWQNVYTSPMSYAEYVARERNRFYTDNGYHVHKHPIPKRIRNKLLERPFRQASKQAVRKAVQFDIDISIKLPPFNSWVYW